MPADLADPLKADEEDRKTDHAPLVQVKADWVAAVTATIETNLWQGRSVVKEGSRRRRRPGSPSFTRGRSTASCATGFSTCPATGRQNVNEVYRRCLGKVRCLCPGMFEGINQNTPFRKKRSAAAPHGRRSLLSPADMTRLSEHILRVSDVLCLSAVTIRSLVLEWLDAEGHDLGEAGLAWHALELQEARQVRERGPQP